MSLLVLKFGGTSVGSCDKIKKVAKLIKKHYDKKNKVIVVSSAMAGITNDLIEKSKKISEKFEKSEYDVLVSAGEQIACSLLAGSLVELGLKSRSWLSWQLPILTEGKHSLSRIKKINTKHVLDFINKGGIPVITGFQGISINRRITTLGRGGSDSSAIAIAKFFNADSCIIYTDVEGVYTTDPKVNLKAKKIDKISYEEMLEMASLGTKVMQSTSVQDAMLNNIVIDVRSTFSNKTGTKISDESSELNKKVVTGVAYTKNEAKITLSEIKQRQSDVQKEIEELKIEAKNKISQIEEIAEKKLSDQIQKRQNLAEAKINQLARDANSEIHSHITSTSIEAAIKVLEKKLNTEEKQKLINSSINELNNVLKN